MPRVIAVDWSGASGDRQRRAMCLAEAAGGELVRVEGGRTRVEVEDLLIAESRRDPDLVVGLDFAFSLPAWYLAELALTPRTLWAALADGALTPGMQRVGLARWLNALEPPFWMTGEAHRLLRREREFRRTEAELRAPGVQPKSVFQLVGAGQVGRGSLYGMQSLHRLAAAGFRIWPFDSARLPLVVEIFPRLLTGPVRKSSARERSDHLAGLDMAPSLRAVAASNEDAFDAAVSALVMGACLDQLTSLPEAPAYAVEGKIWSPVPGVKDRRTA